MIDGKVQTAIIIAAGRGSRMMPLTKAMPKCLVLVHDNPIISYSLNALLRNNILNIIMVIGYEGEKIESYIQDKFPQMNITFVKNNDWESTNSLVSLQLALCSISEFRPYVILESDIVYDSRLLQLLLENPSKTSTLLNRYEKNLSGTFATVVSGVLTGWMHESRRDSSFPIESSYKTVNITTIRDSKIHRVLLAVAENTLLTFGRRAPVEYAFQSIIENGVAITSTETNGMCWAELDTPEEIIDFEEKVEKRHLCAEFLE